MLVSGIKSYIRSLSPAVDVSENLLVGIAICAGRFTAVSFVHGLAVSVVGAALLLWCAGHSRPGRVEGGDVSGPWQFVRHPETVARFLIVFGIILMARAPWVFGVAILTLGLQYKHLVRQGDAELSRWLGPTFSMYRLFVPSFLPQFLPARLPQFTLRTNVQSLPWSAKKVWRRRSVVLTLGILTAGLTWTGLGLFWEASPWWYRGVGVLVILRAFWLLRGELNVLKLVRERYEVR